MTINKGEFNNIEALPVEEEIPAQEEFFRVPVRFGSVPIDEQPLGYDRKYKFNRIYPRVNLPTQVVQRVTFGHPELEPNRLFWGDNLHVMRMLPSGSIDLIYIDPPFFSGEQYNVLFGDQNELRSFIDIWEGGMPGYLVWLNARLYEMKRLLKKTGSIYVHLDWHASHYVKEQMDKIFGYETFRNEIVWCYRQGGRSNVQFPKKHDILLWYSKGEEWCFNADVVRVAYQGTGGYQTSGKGVTSKLTGTRYLPNPLGKVVEDWWDIPALPPMSSERIGYPTQKPVELLQRIIDCSCPQDGVCADFFCGGGSFIEAAAGCRVERDERGVSRKHFYPEKARRWIACDQSRVAVAITADRVASLAEQMSLEQTGKPVTAPDFTIEHWGVYEIDKLSRMPEQYFREFVVRAFGGTPVSSIQGIHGYKGQLPLWVGKPSTTEEGAVSGKDVLDFARAVAKEPGYSQQQLRDAVMLAWAFLPSARKAAKDLAEREKISIDFVRIKQIRIDSDEFRSHILSLRSEKADYSNFLTFVFPPQIRVGIKRIGALQYKFDVSESICMNMGARIINVQWDFNYKDIFTTSPGYSFIRGKNREPLLQVVYKFPDYGRYKIACKIQDDLGGEAMWTDELEVS